MACYCGLYRAWASWYMPLIGSPSLYTNTVAKAWKRAQTHRWISTNLTSIMEVSYETDHIPDLCYVVSLEQKNLHNYRKLSECWVGGLRGIKAWDQPPVHFCEYLENCYRYELLIWYHVCTLLEIFKFSTVTLGLFD